jgi:hypothetical protein
MGGTNDFAGNWIKNFIKTIKKTLTALTCMDVGVLNIPTIS